MNTNGNRRCALGLTAVAVLVATAGCGDGTTGASKDSAADPPDSIVCEVGGDYSGTVTAEPTRGEAQTGSGENFGPMRLDVTFSVSPTESDAVAVVVTDESGKELTRVLYQIGTPLQDIEFQGGHGFTGLHYVNHDGRQLQFWCELGSGA